MRTETIVRFTVRGALLYLSPGKAALEMGFGVLTYKGARVFRSLTSAGKAAAALETLGLETELVTQELPEMWN